MQDDLTRLYARTAAKVATLTNMPVGPVLIAKLGGVARLPMDAATAVDVVALWSKVESWIAAQKMISVSDAVSGVRGKLVLTDQNEALMLAAQEIACATQSHYVTVANHVALVERVSDCLPASWDALDRGDLTVAHLKAIERETRGCSPRVTQVVDQQIVPVTPVRSASVACTPFTTSSSAPAPRPRPRAAPKLKCGWT